MAHGQYTGETDVATEGDTPMRALSLWQPWASLIAQGIKRIETRH
jgi:hypothetical protein